MLSLTALISYIAKGGRVTSTVYGPGDRFLGTATMANPGLLLEMVKSVIPKLSFTQHKGESGRIGVVGGSKEYTGAPYFAALAALKVGADLSHVFCSQDSATVIKSYSPELIVHPLLDVPGSITEIGEWVPRLHALVVGPGLGRDPAVLETTSNVIQLARGRDLPVVIDADGLFLVTQSPEVISKYKRAILTPNAVEFVRLYEKVCGEKPPPEEPVMSVRHLSEKLGNVTIVKKGEADIMSDGINVLVCGGEGSPRRCGGQGDLLSGSMGVFSFWAHQAQNSDCAQFLQYGPTLTAAYAACLLTRQCNKMAFQEQGRSTTTSDMMAHIRDAFRFLYE